MSESHEGEALLPNSTRNQIGSHQKYFGRTLAVISALTFALANFFIKKMMIKRINACITNKPGEKSFINCSMRYFYFFEV